MSKNNMKTKDLIVISAESYKYITGKLKDKRGEGRPFDVIVVLAIVHRMLFARIECEIGIDEARKFTDELIELLEKTSEEGAWDEENKCIK